MKRNQALDRNQIVIVCLFVICLLLTLVIFYVSNHAEQTNSGTKSIVTSKDLVEVYAFLEQDEALRDILDGRAEEEPFSYNDYREFLEEIHVWDAVAFEQLPGWDASGKKKLTYEMLLRSRDLVAELFEMSSFKESETLSEESNASMDDPTDDRKTVDEHTTVRVLLLQEKQALRENVYFSSNGPYTITWEDRQTEKKKNKVTNARQLKLDLGESAKIASKDGELYLTDEKGDRISLGYRGTFLITHQENGFVLINEVEIEDYLYGVVQSEMPAYFETEALKAQAVCARTYIVSQLMQDHYPQYDADVDDSVNYQVYNKAAPDERVLAAVDATKGMIITKNDTPIHAYFFSTSHGITSGREIWGLSDLDYLMPVCGNKNSQTVDLSEEEAFRTYIREVNEDDYDRSAVYYRWKSYIDLSARLDEMHSLLYKIDEMRPDCVIIKNTLGEEIPATELSQWKQPSRLQVLERSPSGAVLRLQIVFSEGTVELSNESFIRQIVGLWVDTMQDKDGNFVSAGELLPSVYFYVQPIKDGIVLFGGGFGHGIGMSQYGADGMAKEGADMKQILNFYYQNVELSKIYANDTSKEQVRN